MLRSLSTDEVDNINSSNSKHNNFSIKQQKRPKQRSTDSIVWLDHQNQRHHQDRKQFAHDARPILPKAAFFIGDLRDGLPMLNMQAAFLVSSRGLNEKQVGILFLAFGLSQFLCMAPVGYFLDYSNKKIQWVISAALLCSTLTVLTAATALNNGENMTGQIILKVVQGGVTAVFLPGFNGITLGIVGSTGFTHQVSRNRMMNHIGTALVVAIGSLVAYLLYPKIGALFLVSPLAAIGVYYNLKRIIPTHVDRDAARSLILESRTMTEYELADDVALAKQHAKTIHYWDESCISDDVTRSSPLPQSLLVDKSCVNVNNDTNSSSSSLSNNNNKNEPAESRSPYYHLSDRPTPPPSETAAPRNYSTSPTPTAFSELMSKKSSYRPPAIALESGLDPPSTTATQDAHPDNNNSTRLRQQQQHPSHAVAAVLGGGDDQHSAASSSQDRHQHSTTASRTSYSSQPSFNFGWYQRMTMKQEQNQQQPINNTNIIDNNTLHQPPDHPQATTSPPRARTPMDVLMNPTLIVFCVILFFFNLANSSVLPLVMQSLALRDAQAGILLSGLCILIAQAFMSFFAKLCGDYSPYWGRKNMMLVGLASLTLRCFLLTFLVPAEDSAETERGSHILKALILSTQFLDSVGGGILGTTQILVTSDISGGTGRFSLLMGVTTGSMCLGATVSSYLGQMIAYEYGYTKAYTVLGMISLIPFVLYVFLMPETLPDYARPQPKRRRRRLRELLRRLNEQRRQILQSKNNPFRRRAGEQQEEEEQEEPSSSNNNETAGPTSITSSKQTICSSTVRHVLV